MSRYFIVLLLCWLTTGVPIRTIDGDTFVVRISIWHGLEAIETIRILGVDTPEMRGREKKAGKVAKEFTSQWLSQGPMSIYSCKRDSFGRLLAKVSRGEENLAQELIKSGNGKPY
jgi:micrococcal nuclease